MRRNLPVTQIPFILLAAAILLGSLIYVSSRAITATTSSVKPEPVYYKDKVLVLTYHHIDPNQAGPTITPELFKSHLDALQTNKYNVISMEKYLQFARTGEPIPPNAVVITFDDGYESFHTYAYPELKKRGFPATNFIVVKSTDIVNPAALPHLTWDQMREMKKNGMSFYSHTYNQHRMMNTAKAGNPQPILANPVYLPGPDRVETPAEYQTRIREDLALAERRLRDELGEQPRLLAYPYGAYNETVVKIGKELGIELFFTVQEGINGRNDVQVKRINAGIPEMTADALLAKLKQYHESQQAH